MDGWMEQSGEANRAPQKGGESGGAGVNPVSLRSRWLFPTCVCVCVCVCVSVCVCARARTRTSVKRAREESWF